MMNAPLGFATTTPSQFSPHEHIANEQFKRIKQLLQDTDYTLETIATKVAVSSAAYLSVFFKEHIGQTPGDFRRAARSIESNESFFPGDKR